MTTESPHSARYQQILKKEERRKRLLWSWFPGYHFSNEIFEHDIRNRLEPGVLWIDLGCGRNDLVEEMSDCRAKAIGLDTWIHPRLNPDSRHRFVRAGINNLPIKPNSVDLFSANDVFEHLENPLAALQQAYKALKPGGFLITRTPNKMSPLFIVARMIPDGHKKSIMKSLFGVSPEDVFPTYYRANRAGVIKRLLSSAGFSRINVHVVEDVHTAFGLLFFLSILYYLLVRLPFCSFLRTNLVVVAEK
ncbi:MAG: class I SAM-dependent methyltransferase [bacterium]|nr:class I SAM-dependent methyltransferase [bacterium]